MNTEAFIHCLNALNLWTVFITVACEHDQGIMSVIERYMRDIGFQIASVQFFSLK